MGGFQLEKYSGILLSSNVSKEPPYAERYVLFYVTEFQYVPFCGYGITGK